MYLQRRSNVRVMYLKIISALRLTQTISTGPVAKSRPFPFCSGAGSESSIAPPLRTGTIDIS